MKVLLSSNDVKLIKNELGSLLPEIKSSHRVEAMARGFGFKTNASLRSELKNKDFECIIQNLAFHEYLKSKSFSDFPYEALSEAVVRIKLKHIREEIIAIQSEAPLITSSGYGTSINGWHSTDINSKEFKNSRADMLTPSSIDEFLRAKDFLVNKRKRKSINIKAGSSYGLKHQAERFHRELGVDNPYISNGMFIAAAIALGFEYRPNGLNVYLNISSRDKKPTEKSVKDRRPLVARHSGGKMRVKAWRNLMVGAINAGIEQNLFSLDENDNRWEGEGAIYHFSISNIPAIGWVRDAGHGELSIHVAAYPTQMASKHIQAFNAGTIAGEAFASGYLERKSGKWLQTPKLPCNAFRKEMLPIIAELDIAPKGYKDGGHIIL